PQWALPSVALMSVWSVGGSAIIYLAGLQNIPGMFYEAAAVDGANPRQQFWYITVPLLMPTTLFVMIISIINSFQVFTPIFLLTRGGPHGATRVLPILIYENAFVYLKMGYASAMAVILFAILMVLTLLQMRVFRVELE
ncbi:MAG TPA: sugar ABC transporter permease, partial [Anaerolineae bacterium]|nr:sugar ABC transporter permease [Anaerolineae bacterium]